MKQNKKKTKRLRTARPLLGWTPLTFTPSPCPTFGLVCLLSETVYSSRRSDCSVVSARNACSWVMLVFHSSRCWSSVRSSVVLSSIVRLTNKQTNKRVWVTNKQTNVFVKPRTSPFTGGHSSHALRLGPLGGARRTQMRSSALGVLPQCPRGLMLDCARHTSHCESNFGSFCRGCPTQRSRVPSSVSWVDSSRLRSCSVAASRLGFYLVSPPSSRLGSGPRLVASSRVGLAGGSWWLAVAGWCLAV